MAVTDIFLQRFILCYAVWLVLSGARADFLLPGVPVCLLAAALNERIWRSGGRRLSLVRIVAYVPGFLWRSLLGGLDVAWRVVHPTVPVRATFLRYRGHESGAEGRVMFADVLSLMPGTLPAGDQGRDMLVHVLAESTGTQRRIAREEERIRALFRAPAEARR